MAIKLIRQTLTQFGSTVNGASEVGVFGSGATGSPTYTASITLMQSLAAWNRGWAAETIANNRPFLEDMNAVDCVFGYQLSYMLQEGIPEYDTTGNSFYFLNSIVQYSGITYQVINDNGGAGISATLPTSLTYWQPLRVAAQLGIWTSISAGSIYQAATDGFVMATASASSFQYAIEILTDSSSAPSTERASTEINLNSGLGNGQSSFVMSPVRKGDYYEVVLVNGSIGNLFFIGSGK